MDTSTIGVVIATRDRASRLLSTLERLARLPERPPVVVVDNGSADGTPVLVRAAHPWVHVVALAGDRGAGARNLGAGLLRTPYVAFNDDDSWWEPGALGAAVRLLDAHPRLGLLAARVVVGPACAPDPVCQAMADSPLAPDARLPGVPVLGFLACGAVVRRDAFLGVGGFEARFGIGGEEQLLALDLAAAGWGLAYVDGLVVHHHPSPVRDVRARRRREHRNALWTAWLRRPRRQAVSRTAALAGGGLRDGARRGALMDAVRGLPWILVARRPVPAGVERAVRQLEP